MISSYIRRASPIYYADLNNTSLYTCQYCKFKRYSTLNKPYCPKCNKPMVEDITNGN